MKGTVLAVNLSRKKGKLKTNIKRGFLLKGHGLCGDAHAEGGDRQISIFPVEAFTLVPKEILFHIGESEYTENITVIGIPLVKLHKKVRLRIGAALVELVHIGKNVLEDSGKAYIVSREGRFGKVLEDGYIQVGDKVEIVHTIAKTSLKGLVITISDSAAQNLREDKSGACAVMQLEQMGITVVKHVVVSDEIGEIQDAILKGIDQEAVDIVITTGGTGVSPRDVTPEATGSLLTRELPGFSEIIRVEGYRKTPYSIISRGLAGFRDASLIVNLPGSPKAVAEAFEVLKDAMIHAVEKAKGDQTPCAS